MRLTGAALGLVVIAACGASPTEETLVFAASSLSNVFSVIESEFEARHPDVDVVVATAGSQVLAAQILEGAPASVFASADRIQMQRVVDAGLVLTGPHTFAHNQLALVVQAGNPLGISTVDDLALPGPRIVLAGEEVPAGRYSRLVLGDLDLGPVATEPEVRLVVAKVALGEADVGIAYITDVAAWKGAVEIAIELDVVADYPIAILEDSAAARELVAFVLSAEGQAILASHGFKSP